MLAEFLKHRLKASIEVHLGVDKCSFEAASIDFDQCMMRMEAGSPRVQEQAALAQGIFAPPDVEHCHPPPCSSMYFLSECTFVFEHLTCAILRITGKNQSSGEVRRTQWFL